MMEKWLDRTMPGLGRSQVWTESVDGQLFVKSCYWMDEASTAAVADVEVRCPAAILPRIPEFMRNFENVCTGAPKGRGNN